MEKESPKSKPPQVEEISNGSNKEFRPSVLGWITDKIILGDGPGIPTDLLAEMKRVEGPYLDVLNGKIADPKEAEETRKNYENWYRKLYNYLNRE